MFVNFSINFNMYIYIKIVNRIISLILFSGMLIELKNKIWLRAFFNFPNVLQ